MKGGWDGRNVTVFVPATAKKGVPSVVVRLLLMRASFFLLLRVLGEPVADDSTSLPLYCVPLVLRSTPTLFSSRYLDNAPKQRCGAELVHCMKMQ